MAVSLDGRGLMRITDHPERDGFAAFHLDGKRIAFVGERKDRFDLYLAGA